MGAPEAKTPEPEEVDSGWDDEEDPEDVDSAWGELAAKAAGEDGEPGGEQRAPARVLTPEEREARAARDAARKERLRAKAAEKADRRKARAAAAAAKQKKGAPRAAGPAIAKAVERRPPRRVEQKKEAVARSGEAEPEPEPEAEAEEAEEAPESERPVRRAATVRRDWRPIVVLVVLLVVAGGVALFLWKR